MKSHAGKHAIYKYISSKIEFLVWVKGHRKWLLGLESVCVSCVMCVALVQEGSGKDDGRTVSRAVVRMAYKGEDRIASNSTLQTVKSGSFSYVHTATVFQK